MENLENVVLDTEVAEEEVKFELDLTDSESQTGNQEQTEETETEVTEVEETQEPVIDYEKENLKKALQAERAKIKALKNDPRLKLGERVANNISAGDATKAEKIIEEQEIEALVDKGYDIAEAKRRIEEQKELTMLRAIARKEQINNQINALKADPYYADIDEHKDEVVDYALEKGLTVEESYNALFAQNKIANMEKAIEQRILANLQKKQKTAIPSLSSGGNAKVDKPTYKLTETQLAVAKMAGMTPQEYYQNIKK